MKIPFLSRLLEIKEAQLIMERANGMILGYIARGIDDLTKLQRRKKRGK